MIESLVIWVLTHSTTFWALIFTGLVGYLIGLGNADDGTKKAAKRWHA
ncbi:hypothetical protein [Lacticaseibacillus saniviri]